MREPTQTPFQRVAETKVQEVLASRGVAIAERVVAKARLPHMTDSELVIKLVTEDGAQIWLYEDEATFSEGPADHRFEHADYRSSEDLLRALIETIARA